MDQRAFLEEHRGRFRAAVASGEAVLGIRSWDDLQSSKVAGLWSPAQVVHHLVVSHRGYLSAMSEALSAPSTPEGVKTTFMGRQIALFAGPTKKNTPVPRGLPDPPSNVPADILAEWRAQNAAFEKLFEAAETRSLATKYTNPVVGFLRMTVADGFAIVTGHTERHAAQIVERS
ncbi:MAG: DinB family protein [Fimbriimonadaceae bacterium]|nr:DinB family protein [Fimbriimonadaceae bacterium]QYK55667.1 MAG: DinB family protein [Fimbriimonadaceae bacterium]